MPLDNFFNKILALQDFDIVKETSEIINENAYFIEGLLRLQLQKGKDGIGKEVTIFGKDYYSDATIQDKRYNGEGLGKFTEWITNYMSGAFYNSLKVHTSGDVFQIESNVPYFGEILKRSGDVIMELDKTSLAEFREEILIPQLRIRWEAKVLNGI